LPLSQTRRFEAGTSLSRYYYRIDRFNTYYDLLGIPVGTSREKLDAPTGFTLHKMDVAYVEDNSVFGYTSPIKGHRARLSLEKFTGKVNMYGALVDYRKYFNIRPLTIAFRGYHYGRYGNDAESSIFYPLYVGYPWLVRGYNVNSFGTSQALLSSDVSINQLAGSRIAVGNVELRLPLTGPERMALIKFKYVPSELSLFMDGGFAWDSDYKFSMDTFTRWVNSNPDERLPIFSVGASLRLNLLGYIILEPYYAIPLQKRMGKGVFGVNFIPGW
jgi:outer membrane protein assembly factor BamA